ncbi:MAG: hypothetical protein HYX38_16505 [Rhodospirillales bacterium]|nr:hypothetical protein [Rhodospirillales bacterium]
MTQSKLFALASLIAVGLLGSASQAQQQPPSAGGPPPAQQQGQQPGYAGGPGPGQPSGTVGGPPAPVVFVTSVEVLRSDRNGGLDVVRVRGLVTGSSWSQPHLIPITQGQPRDGMLDLIFQASAPAGAAGLGPFMPVEAILPVETGHPYKGVRVRGGNNAISLKAIPGYAEAAPPKEDCAKCLGKFFVAKGANPPAGAAADNVVREADLPYTLRVIKPTDGIPSYALDPNRLTLLLSEDGRIVDGAWD